MGLFWDSNWADRIERKLNLILRELNLSTQQEAVNMATLQEAFTELTNEVQETQGAAASAITLIQGLQQQIADLIAGGSVTPEQLQALSAQLDASQQELAAAVASNP